MKRKFTFVAVAVAGVLSLGACAECTPTETESCESSAAVQPEAAVTVAFAASLQAAPAWVAKS